MELVAEAERRFADMSEHRALASTTCKKNLGKRKDGKQPKKSVSKAGGEPKKRGRPPGSKNKKTLLEQAAKSVTKLSKRKRIEESSEESSEEGSEEGREVEWGSECCDTCNERMAVVWDKSSGLAKSWCMDPDYEMGGIDRCELPVLKAKAKGAITRNSGAYTLPLSGRMPSLGEDGQHIIALFVTVLSFMRANGVALNSVIVRAVLTAILQEDCPEVLAANGDGLAMWRTWLASFMQLQLHWRYRLTAGSVVV
ncbi:hypothetical protein FOA52_010137 [Chlamydomonas sp. UWO 241]|nr:hypothetical protein FOA52_010137 [Chlamydomonas sp. UWO 241]